MPVTFLNHITFLTFSWFNTKNVLIAGLIFSIWLTYKIVKRMLQSQKQNTRPGCITYGYVFAIAAALTSLFSGGAFMLGKTIHNYFHLPKYQAIIIDHHVYQKEERYDDNGTSRYRTVTMYQPKVKFEQNNGDSLTLLSDISSGSPKPLGSTITIGYKEGLSTAEEFSATKLFLMLGLTVMLFIMGYFLYAGILYATGRNMTKVKTLGTKFLLLFFIPAAMLSMLLMLCYALYLYFSGEKEDMPLWAVCICAFFALVLLLALLAYFKSVPASKKK